MTYTERNSSFVESDAAIRGVHINGNGSRDLSSNGNGVADIYDQGLSENQFLRHLPADFFSSLRQSLRPVKLSKEQFIYQQDDRLEYIYFPETAVISEYRILEDGRMIEVAIVGSESVVGLSAVFSPTRAANCVQVTQSGRAKRIESAIFAKVVREHANMLRQISPYFDEYLRQISQKVICNTYHSVEERLCTWLLRLQDRCEKRMLQLTHEQIARSLGVYRPSVTCIALEMRKNGVIDYSRGGVTIVDRDQLEALACGCYGELSDPPNR